MKIKDNKLLTGFLKAFKISFFAISLNLSFNAYSCKTGSKLGHFPKIANLFNQNGRGQSVVKIRDKQFPT